MHQSAFTSSPGGYHTWLHHKLEDNGKPAGGRPQPGQELTYAQTDKTENILPQAPSIGQAHTHTRLMALCPGLPRWASTRKVKPMWILLKQETVVSAGTYASLHLAPDRLPCQHPTTQFNTGWMPFLPIYWIGLGIKTTANQVLTITEAQEHCCCNSWQVCTGRHENHTQINSSVRLSYNLLHHISTKKCAVNNDEGSMQLTAGLLIGTGRGNMLSANWLGFHKRQLNDWQQQVKAILYTRAAGTGLEVDVCDKRRCRVRWRLQQTQLLTFILLLLFKMTSQTWKSSYTLCPPPKKKIHRVNFWITQSKINWFKWFLAYTILQKFCLSDFDPVHHTWKLLVHEVKVTFLHSKKWIHHK